MSEVEEIECKGCGVIRKWRGSECLTVCDCMKRMTKRCPDCTPEEDCWVDMLMCRKQSRILPWPERVAMLSINPDAASTADVAQLASELMNCHQQDRLKTKELNILVQENRKLGAQFALAQQAIDDAIENILERGGDERWPIIRRLRIALNGPLICKACGCTIDVHGCGCNPNDA